jgi:long-chain acyl-CoA synthetase
MQIKRPNTSLPRSYLDEALKTIPDYFFEWEEKQPDAVSLRQPDAGWWRVFTWAETGRMARPTAAALRKLGLQPGDKVGIVSKNCYPWVVAGLAIMMGGFVSVPFYPNLTADQSPNHPGTFFSKV